MIAFPLERFAQDLFTASPGVGVRCIEKVDTLIQCVIDDPNCVLFAGLPAEGHRSQTYPGDFQAGSLDICVFHKNLLSEFFEKSGAPETHIEFVEIEVEDGLPVFRRRAQDCVLCFAADCVFRMTEQRSSDAFPTV